MIPDKPGFYWFLDWQDKPSVAEVTTYPNSPTLRVWETGCEAGDRIEQYRWLGPVEPYRETSSTLAMVDDWYADVLAFHRKFAPSIIGESPRVPGFECYDTRFIHEEYVEILEAKLNGDIPSVADGIVDLIYVACRMAIIWGIDLRPVWRVVHAANMAKVGGDVRDDWKVCKPPGWTPPDVAGELLKQGWQG